jgi:hypothetical protein
MIANVKRMLSATALLVSLTGGIAHADLAGNPGRIAGFEHNDDSSDDFGVNTISVYIDEGGGVIQRYYNHGQACAGRILDNDQQLMLIEAMRGKLQVLPYYKPGGANVRCLVAFTFALKPGYVDDVAK